MPTSLKPFVSNLLMMSPMMPLCTPSGLTAMKVRSSWEDIILKRSKDVKNKKRKLEKQRPDSCRESLTDLAGIWHRQQWGRLPRAPTPLQREAKLRALASVLSQQCKRQTCGTATHFWPHPRGFNQPPQCSAQLNFRWQRHRTSKRQWDQTFRPNKFRSEQSKKILHTRQIHRIGAYRYARALRLHKYSNLHYNLYLLTSKLDQNINDCRAKHSNLSGNLTFACINSGDMQKKKKIEKPIKTIFLWCLQPLIWQCAN